MSTIQATLTRCRNAQPLIELQGGPFNGAEIRPAELRQLAQHLLALADLSVKLPMGGKHWRPTVISIEAKV